MSNKEEKQNEHKSLIKYDQPVIVTSTGKMAKGGRGGKDNINTNTEDILNSILPPRESTKDKQQLQIESVSSTPATHVDVIMLHNVKLGLKRIYIKN